MTEQDRKLISEINKNVAVLKESFPKIERSLNNIDGLCHSLSERVTVAESHIDDLRSDRNKPSDPCRKEMGVIHARVDRIIKPDSKVTASKIMFWAAVVSALIGGASAIVVAIS